MSAFRGIIGSLTINLDANIANFETDLTRAEKTARRQIARINREINTMEAESKKATAEMARLGKQLAVVGAVALAVTVREFKKLADEADRIRDLAIQTGLTAEAVQELGFAASQSGSDMESLTSAVIKMQRNINSAEEGLEGTVRAFARIGVSVEQLRGLSPDKQFSLLAQALSEVESESIRNASATEIFGRSVQNLLPLLEEGEAGIERLRQQLRDTGTVLSQEAVDNADRFNDAMGVLIAQLTAFRNSVFTDLIEPLARTADFFANTEEGALQFASIIDTLKTSLVVLGSFIAGRFVVQMGIAIVQFAQAERQIHRLAAANAALGVSAGVSAGSMAVLGRALGFAFGPVGLAVTAVASIVAIGDALRGAARDSDDLHERTRDLIDSFKNINQTAGEAGLQELQTELTASVELVELLQGRVEALRNLPLATAERGDIQVRSLAALEEQLAAAEAHLATVKADIEDLTTVMEEAAVPETPADPLPIDVDKLKEYTSMIDTLRGEMSPLIAIQNKFNAGVEKLDELLADKTIGPAQYAIGFDLLTKQLQKSMMALRNTETRIQSMNQTIQSELERNMKFVDNEGVAQNIQAEIDALKGGEEAWKAYQRAMFQAQEVAALGPDATQEQINAIMQLSGELFDARDAFAGVADSASALGDAMQQAADLSADVFRDLQKGVGRESGLYDKLTVAIEAANLVKAIGAVLSQGQGDPYSAPLRMAAMAAVVSALVGTAISIGNLSGGFSDTAANRQETQGTGTVLGDAAAKSESIAKAIETTANATSELVGINRGMLHALQSLAAGISGAATVLARTSEGGAFSGLPNTFQPSDFTKLTGGFLGDIFAGIWDSLLGGSAKVTDEGIAILSGTIGDLIDGTLIAAFQEVQYKKWAFGSKKTREELIALGEEAAAQFGLIFGALANTRREGTMALGLSQELIDERIAAFEVAEQRISLMDLTAEEQAAEIEAVISSIFDEMVAAVIPFVRQFQQVGEGLGQTLIRVATSVQVFQEAVQQLGYAADVADPEAFAIMAVGLVELLGGVENFIALFTGFMDRYASDEQKLIFVTDQLTRAFDEVGMVLPETRDGFWALMQSMDATTEEGRKQIATLLELAGVADQYYSLQEDAERDRLAAAEQAAKAAADALALIDQQTATVRDFLGLTSPLDDLTQKFIAAMQAARKLGASQAEYAMIVRKFDRDLQRLTAQLTISVIQMSQDLFSETADGFTDAVEDGVDQVRMVANSLFSEWERALESLQGFADSLLLNSELTTLSPRQQLLEAERQFRDLLARANSGDVEAAGGLPDAARAFLEEARFMFASGPAYDRIFREVQQSLRGVEMPKGIPEFTAEIAENTADTVQAVTDLQNATVTKLERLLRTMDLANSLRDLSFVLERGTIELARELGVPIDQLAAALGIDLSDASAETVLAIVNMAEMLGTDVTSLGDALGVDIAALADQFGIDLAMLDFDTQFAREIDVLSSIEYQITQANIWLRLLADAQLRKDEGITKPPKEPIQSPESYSTMSVTGSATGETPQEQLNQIIRILVQMAEADQLAQRQDNLNDTATLQSLTLLNDLVRRMAA